MTTERTPVPYPSEPPVGFESWGAYIRAKKASATEPESDEDDEPEPQIVVTDRRVGLVSDLVRGPKKAVALAMEMGWQVTINVSDVSHPAVLYKAASDNHNKGDVRTAAKDETWWWITAVAPEGVLGFHAAYQETRSAKTNARGFSFSHARVADPVGMPQELYFEYKTTRLSKNDKAETAASLDSRQSDHDRFVLRANHEYNDGKTWLNHRPMFASARDFEIWLDDWYQLTHKEDSTT